MGVLEKMKKEAMGAMGGFYPFFTHCGQFSRKFTRVRAKNTRAKNPFECVQIPILKCVISHFKN